MRAYKPLWRSTLKVPYIRNVTLHFPIMPGPSSVLAAQVLGMLIEDNDWDDYSPAERSHLLAELSGRASYALTLNNPFGVGRIAQGMGIILAALPAPRGRGLDSLGAMLGINNVHNIFFYSAAGTGSIAVPGVLAGVAIGAVLPASGEGLETAIGTKRVYNSGNPDVTYYEQGLADGVVSDLGRLGHRLNPVSGMGLVNAIFCPAGVPNKEGMSCSIRTDPRGFGLASGAE